MTTTGVLSCTSDALVDPHISSLDPPRVALGYASAATIRGHDFRTQTHVSVDSNEPPTVRRVFDVWLGSNALPTETVSYVDDATLKIVIPNTLAVGLYDLTIRSPAGRSATLSRALTVFEDTSAYPSGGSPSTTSGAAATSLAGGAGSSSMGIGGTLPDVSMTTRVASGGTFSTGSGGTLPDVSTTTRAASGGTFSAGSGGTLPIGSTTLPVASGGSSSPDSAGAHNSGGLSYTSTTTSTSTASGGAGGASSASASGGSGTTAAHDTLWTDGSVLRDACGNAILVRGVQQIFADQAPRGIDWLSLIDEIVATGANAVRIQAETATLGVAGVDSLLTRFDMHNIVAILNPDDSAWLADPAVVSMLSAHQGHLILDAYGPGYDNRTKFLSSATAAVTRLRGYGYRVPFIVLSNNYGRDLPAALDYGAQIIAADPLHNTILGWDAYWGSSNWYQSLYGMTLTQGVAAAASAAFPIQIGLTLITDPPNEYLDYKTLMSETQAHGLGWLWWDWYNPNGPENNLSADGTGGNLLSIGEYVVDTQTVGIAFASMPSCSLP
jgi:mannan endo-1,4-beta-mannosidase